MLNLSQDNLNRMQGAEHHFYKVKTGDTFSAIAARNGLSMTELEQLNPQIKKTNLIYPNQKIQIRPQQETVQSCLYQSDQPSDIQIDGVSLTTQAPLVEQKVLAEVMMLIPGTTDPLNKDKLLHQANGDYWNDTDWLKMLRQIDLDNSDTALNHDFFSWSGDNNVAARGQSSVELVINPLEDAGMRLKQLLYARPKIPFYEGMKDKPLHFHLIGHSHGGNVINEFTHAIKKDFPPLWQIKSLTYLSTPFFNHLHWLDSSKLHPDAKIILVNNEYDITQHTIANYSLINLEVVGALFQQLTALFNEIVSTFKKAFEKIKVADNIFLFVDGSKTVERWEQLAEHIGDTGRQLHDSWSQIAGSIQKHHNIIPFQLRDLLEGIVFRYKSWSDGVEIALRTQAKAYEAASKKQRKEKDYFNPDTLYQALNIIELIDIMSDNIGRNANSSPVLEALDEFLKGIISVFDDTGRTPVKWPSGISEDDVVIFKLQEKDPYHSHGKNVFAPFLAALEGNQKRYRQALDSKDRNQQKRIRQEFLFILLAQIDYSILEWFASRLELAQWGATGELDQAIKNLETRLHWVLEKLNQYHYPLMMTDDLLLHYALKYIAEEVEGNSSDFKTWLENEVRVDQDRLIDRLEQLVKSGKLSIPQLIGKIRNANKPYAYKFKNNQLESESLRGSLLYFMITAHSFSKHINFTDNPDIKEAFYRCFGD